MKFIYSEKATKFCKISSLLLSVYTVDKSKVDISPNFVAFWEYMNFIYPILNPMKLTQMFLLLGMFYMGISLYFSDS